MGALRALLEVGGGPLRDSLSTKAVAVGMAALVAFMASGCEQRSVTPTGAADVPGAARVNPGGIPAPATTKGIPGTPVRIREMEASPTAVATIQPAVTRTPTPAPTCQDAPVRGFGKLWQEESLAREYLGCPSSNPKGERSIQFQAQRFENGVLFWTDSMSLWEKGYVFALFQDDMTFLRVRDNWVEGAEEPPPMEAPPDHFESRARLGKVWREVSGVRGRLGWGLEPEKRGTGAWQAFDQGLMYWFPYLQGTSREIEDRWVYIVANSQPGGPRNDWLAFLDTWKE